VIVVMVGVVGVVMVGVVGVVGVVMVGVVALGLGLLGLSFRMSFFKGCLPLFERCEGRLVPELRVDGTGSIRTHRVEDELGLGSFARDVLEELA